jgi:hypothetical protein
MVMNGLLKLALGAATAGTAAAGIHGQFRAGADRKAGMKEYLDRDRNTKNVQDFVRGSANSGHDRTDADHRRLKSFGGGTTPKAAAYQAAVEGRRIEVGKIRARAGGASQAAMQRKARKEGAIKGPVRPNWRSEAAKKAAETRKRNRGV